MAAMLLGLCCGAAAAAQFDPAELQQLQQEAQAKGVVRVMVNLPGDYDLERLRRERVAVQSQTTQLANTLKAELGTEAWKTGHWNNAMGQIGLYVTPRGLDLLAASTNARMVMRDKTDRTRTRVHDGGRLQPIEARIDADGVAEVEATLNLDALDFDFARDGSVKLRTSAALTAEARERLPRFLDSLNSAAVQNLAALKASAQTAPTPRVTLRITREGFHLLREHPDVRSMQLVRHVDKRPARFSPEALDLARRNGTVDVVITLRDVDPYQPGSGYMSAKAWQAQKQAMRRALDEVLSTSSGGVSNVQDFSEYAAIGARLTESALTRIYQSGDSRILDFAHNQPLGTTGLASSTAIMNMPTAWSAGFTAPGQVIVIYDDGVSKNHEFFKMGGVSKVALEGCWGTTNATYTSICPSQNSTWDSPLALPGSGEPPAVCPPLRFCGHGTQMAGIAAGRANTLLPPGMQGVAPDALLVSAQVFSFDLTGVLDAAYYYDDLLLGLQTLDQNVATDNYVASLSLVDPVAWTNDCPSIRPAFTSVVANLHSRRIPVVIAAGNIGHRFGISFPACLPLTIKVAGTLNSGSGTIVPPGSNIAPDTFTGPLLLAPGYFITTSSLPAPLATTPAAGGTSAATPHVAGYYAAVKAGIPGVTIPDATAWIYGGGSVAAPQTFPSLGTYQFRRIGLP